MYGRGKCIVLVLVIGIGEEACAICDGEGGLLDDYGSDGLARAAPSSESIDNDDVVGLDGLLESGLTIRYQMSATHVAQERKDEGRRRRNSY